MAIQLKNNAVGYLATAISASDTGAVLQTGNGASFPALGAGDYFYATLESTGGTQEIVKATARSGDSLTIVRAQEGTTAQSFAAGSRFELRVTAGSIQGYVQDRIVSVLDFGAVGDDIVDDTAAVQTAISTVGAQGGGDIHFVPGKTYSIRTLYPKSNVTLQLNGATLKLRAATNERIFDGSVPGVNFAVMNGTLNGNQANNAGNFNLSGASNFIGWNGVTFRDVTWRNVYRASLIFGSGGSGNRNIVLENILHEDCGQANSFGKFAYALECYAGTRQITIKNFTVRNHYGFGIHFFGATDFEADNLLFENLTYNNVAIAITWTQAKRGRVSNVRCISVDGDPLEVNASQDQLIENVNVENAGDIPILMGDNNTGISNERVIWRNVKTTGTGGAFSLRINIMQYCQFLNCNFDKGLDTTVVGIAANDRQNLLQDVIFAVNLSINLTRYRKFQLKRVSTANFYVNDASGQVVQASNPFVVGSNLVAVAVGATTYVDFDAFNIMGNRGFVAGRLRVITSFNNQQGAYQEVAFLASSNNTTLNLGTPEKLINAIERSMTITADPANRRIALTNNNTVAVNVQWTFELQGGDN